MGKMEVATVARTFGVGIDPNVRVLLPDNQLRRFEDAIECTRSTKKVDGVERTIIKPKVDKGAHVLLKSITLKNGMQVKIDRSSLMKSQTLDFDFAADAKPKKKKKNEDGDGSEDPDGVAGGEGDDGSEDPDGKGDEDTDGEGDPDAGLKL